MKLTQIRRQRQKSSLVARLKAIVKIITCDSAAIFAITEVNGIGVACEVVLIDTNVMACAAVAMAAKEIAMDEIKEAGGIDAIKRHMGKSHMSALADIFNDN